MMAPLTYGTANRAPLTGMAPLTEKNMYGTANSTANSLSFSTFHSPLIHSPQNSLFIFQVLSDRILYLIIPHYSFLSFGSYDR